MEYCVLVRDVYYKYIRVIIVYGCKYVCCNMVLFNIN